MNVVVNGKAKDLPSDTTVKQLLEILNVAPERVVVEVNLNILKRIQHTDVILKENDQVEVVQFVGGGALDCGVWNAEFGIGFRHLEWQIN